MTFVNVDDKFRATHAAAVKNMLSEKGIESPKCVIFTHSTNETIEVRDMLMEVND